MRFSYIGRPLIPGIDEQDPRVLLSFRIQCIGWLEVTISGMVKERQRVSISAIGGLLTLGALVGGPDPARADTMLSIGANGVQYQIDYEFFVAPDSPRGIDPRLLNTAWWGQQQAAEDTAHGCRHPLAPPMATHRFCDSVSGISATGIA
ncbi:hypothetical protein KBY95_07990 [Cyanobium sp. Aljojuca 7A6]|nr:hypothetical protein [Cyanobium sp. La Preciosa 7G6]MCP9937022.1 hypothetical protein [Cyanobium sp. Aljojuca 7A6]